jgi:hypothetical protein
MSRHDVAMWCTSLDTMSVIRHSDDMTHIKRALVRNLTAAGVVMLAMWGALALDVVSAYVVAGITYMTP